VSQDKKDESFRVIDRRLFTSDGELRPEAVEYKNAEQAKPAPAQEAAAQPGKPAASPAPPAPAMAPAPDTPAVPREAPQANRSFAGLVDFLAQNAAMLLGAYADPRTGQAVLDLDGARELIDMLDALREKSRGNLTAEEDQILADRLGRLKFTYLEMTKAAAQAMREKAGRQP